MQELESLIEFGSSLQILKIVKKACENQFQVFVIFQAGIQNLSN